MIAVSLNKIVLSIKVSIFSFWSLSLILKKLANISMSNVLPNLRGRVNSKTELPSSSKTVFKYKVLSTWYLPLPITSAKVSAPAGNNLYFLVSVMSLPLVSLPLCPFYQTLSSYYSIIVYETAL